MSTVIGVNTFGLARNIQVDQCGTIARLGRMGFDLVEPLLAPLDRQGDYPKVVLSRETLPDFLNQCGNAGLGVQTAHIFADGSIPKDRTLEYLTWVHEHSGISYFVFSGQMETVAQAEEQAAFLSSLSMTLRKEHCRILYHNHARELCPISEDGETAMDRFFAICDPEILLQLDVGWAGVAGNEEKIAARFAQHIFCLHFKDFVDGVRGAYTDQTMPQDRFAAVGNGDIHSAQIIAMSKDFPNFGGTLIIDQDHSTGDIMEDVESGLHWLRGAVEA